MNKKTTNSNKELKEILKELKKQFDELNKTLLENYSDRLNKKTESNCGDSNGYREN